ncbi:MAG: hypothetical protein R3B74_09820 [Nitrospirales bacterium]|nr:hypothetical protein [Nitrospirales bacterium]
MKPTRNYNSKMVKGIVALIITTILVIGLSGFIFCSETPVPNTPPTPVPAGAIPIGRAVVPPGAICTAAIGETCTTPGATCWFFDTCTNIYDTRTGQCNCTCL